MKKLFTSTLLAVVAVPFLVAAPAKTTKAQNTASAPATSKTAVKKTHKAHAKKSVKKTAQAAPAPAK